MSQIRVVESKVQARPLPKNSSTSETRGFYARSRIFVTEQGEAISQNLEFQATRPTKKYRPLIVEKYPDLRRRFEWLRKVDSASVFVVDHTLMANGIPADIFITVAEVPDELVAAGDASKKQREQLDDMSSISALPYFIQTGFGSSGVQWRKTLEVIKPGDKGDFRIRVLYRGMPFVIRIQHDGYQFRIIEKATGFPTHRVNDMEWRFSFEDGFNERVDSKIRAIKRAKSQK